MWIFNNIEPIFKYIIGFLLVLCFALYFTGQMKKAEREAGKRIDDKTRLTPMGEFVYLIFEKVALQTGVLNSAYEIFCSAHLVNMFILLSCQSIIGIEDEHVDSLISDAIEMLQDDLTNEYGYEFDFEVDEPFDFSQESVKELLDSIQLPALDIMQKYDFDYLTAARQCISATAFLINKEVQNYGIQKCYEIALAGICTKM